MIFIIHSSIINDKIVWCKWARDSVHFTIQNTSNYTIIWHKSFCLLKSTAWPPLMKSKIIRKIPHRLRLHTAWAPLMKSKIIRKIPPRLRLHTAWTPLMKFNIIRKIPHRLKLHTAWAPLINLKIIPFISGANCSPPSSGNHWLLFVKPVKRRAQEVGNGRRKGEGPTTKEWWERHLFPQKTRTSVINRCPFTLQIYVLW